MATYNSSFQIAIPRTMSFVGNLTEETNHIACVSILFYHVDISFIFDTNHSSIFENIYIIICIYYFGSVSPPDYTTTILVFEPTEYIISNPKNMIFIESLRTFRVSNFFQEFIFQTMLFCISFQLPGWFNCSKMFNNIHVIVGLR